MRAAVDAVYVRVEHQRRAVIDGFLLIAVEQLVYIHDAALRRPQPADGADARLDPATSVSADVYLTNLRDLFLSSTYQNGTYTPASGADAGNTEPLYFSQIENLGQARYEGIELALRRTPRAGFGYLTQSYDMPVPTTTTAGHYDVIARTYYVNLWPGTGGVKLSDKPSADAAWSSDAMAAQGVR